MASPRQAKEDLLFFCLNFSGDGDLRPMQSQFNLKFKKSSKLLFAHLTFPRDFAAG